MIIRRKIFSDKGEILKNPLRTAGGIGASVSAGLGSAWAGEKLSKLAAKRGHSLPVQVAGAVAPTAVMIGASKLAISKINKARPYNKLSKEEKISRRDKADKVLIPTGAGTILGVAGYVGSDKLAKGGSILTSKVSKKIAKNISSKKLKRALSPTESKILQAAHKAAYYAEEDSFKRGLGRGIKRAAIAAPLIAGALGATRLIRSKKKD